MSEKDEDLAKSLEALNILKNEVKSKNGEFKKNESKCTNLEREILSTKQILQRADEEARVQEQVLLFLNLRNNATTQLMLSRLISFH